MKRKVTLWSRGQRAVGQLENVRDNLMPLSAWPWGKSHLQVLEFLKTGRINYINTQKNFLCRQWPQDQVFLMLLQKYF